MRVTVRLCPHVTRGTCVRATASELARGRQSGGEEKEGGPAEIQASKTQLEAFQTPPSTQPASLTPCYGLAVENTDCQRCHRGKAQPPAVEEGGLSINPA